MTDTFNPNFIEADPEGLERILKAQALHDESPLKLLDREDESGLSEKGSKKYNYFSEQDSLRQQLANQGISYLKDGSDIYEWKGTHWEDTRYINSDEMGSMVNVWRALHTQLKLCETRHVNEAFKQFLFYCDTPYFTDDRTCVMDQPPNFANFLNGTLWVDRDPQTGAYTLRFEKHRREDYLTSVIHQELPYEELGSGVHIDTPRFSAWLDNVTSSHESPDSLKRALQQIGGAMLIPSFPMIAFITGLPGTGKSTFIKLMLKLCEGYKHACSVQPSDMKGFTLHTLAQHKLNYHTDLNENAVIADDILKSTFDRLKVSVQRKYKTDITSSLPAVHVYACNSLPKTMINQKGVYERRMLVLEMNKKIDHKDMVADFESSLIDSEARGILLWALKGLKDMADNGGRFTQFEQSRRMIQEFEKNHTEYEVFLEECLEYGVKYDSESYGEQTMIALPVGDESSKLPSKEIYKAFQAHCKEIGIPEIKVPSRTKLVRYLKRQGRKEFRSKTTRYIVGFKFEDFVPNEDTAGEIDGPA
jgi:phage/plasmid-associated DNA primase